MLTSFLITSIITRPLSSHHSSHHSSTMNHSEPNTNTNAVNTNITNTNIDNNNNNNNNNNDKNDYYEQRRQFMQQIYNNVNIDSNANNNNNNNDSNNNSPQPPDLNNNHSTDSNHSNHSNHSNRSSKSLLSPSSTTYAASDSFILDSHSPLFNSYSKINKQQFDSIPLNKQLNATLFKPQQSTKPKCIDIDIKNKETKTFTVTPPNSPKAGINKKRPRGRHKSHSFTSGMPFILPMEELKLEEMKENKRKKSNIAQNEHIIPPKKMKKKATEQELQLVLEHFEMALHKNFQEILKQNEPKVIHYRDKIYREAKLNGITKESDDFIRLKILSNVVEFAYMNIEPPNDYTKQTDRKHFKEVAAWSAKFAKDRGIIPPLTLIYSAWCHDIERFIPSTKCEYLPEAVDKYRKQLIHGVTSAKVATCLLKGAPVTQQEIDRIYQMVLHHDIPNPRDDIVILDEKLVNGAQDDLMWELELLMDADSFAFFQSTIYYFILFKSKKNSPDWIWERVLNNVKRLRPHLRSKAAECIHNLSQDILSKMTVDEQELIHLCSESGINSPINSEITDSPRLQNQSEPMSFLKLSEPMSFLKINESHNSDESNNSNVQ